MALPQQKRRECVVQLIYSFELSGAVLSDSATVAHAMEAFKVSKKLAHDICERAALAWSDHIDIDKRIEAAASAYPLERITKVELSVLRLLLWELLSEKSIPLEVALTEGRRLVKKFSHTEAGEFIVAILNAAIEPGDV